MQRSTIDRSLGTLTGVTRRAPETEDGFSCAARLRVLADPTRLEVLRHLFTGALRVSELNERIAIAPNLLSHHLRVLRDAQLVETTRDGRSIIYRIPAGVRGRSSKEAVDLGCCRLSFR